MSPAAIHSTLIRSTEMRDTAHLAGGRVVFNQSVIMARAWMIARKEASFEPGRSAREFLSYALREAWADAKAVAWRLAPPQLSARDRLSLESIGLKGADRPSAADERRIIEAERELANLHAAA